MKWKNMILPDGFLQNLPRNFAFASSTNVPIVFPATITKIRNKIGMHKSWQKHGFAKWKWKNVDIVKAQYFFSSNSVGHLMLFWTLGWLHGSQRSVLRFAAMFGVEIHKMSIVGDMRSWKHGVVSMFFFYFWLFLIISDYFWLFLIVSDCFWLFLIVSDWLLIGFWMFLIGFWLVSDWFLLIVRFSNCSFEFFVLNLFVC